METKKIKVTGNGDGMEQALNATEKLADQIGLDKKNTLRLRLLAEETLCMVRAIVAGFEAEFRAEGTQKDGVRIHLTASADMNYAKKKELIAVSTDKKNAASVGIMGKIRELVENGLYHLEEVENLRTEYGGAPVMYGAMGMLGGGTAMQTESCLWSLKEYRKHIDETKDSDQSAAEAWDELEKSIVAKIADDVRVAISGRKVEMIIEKRSF